MAIWKTGLVCALPLVWSALSCGTAFAAPQASLPESDHARAVRCMAAAISYEAGHEPLAGQEAVGQVILNRLRDPAYPKTVCGVVFQGSERRTGCQFTFTCDGSIDRPRTALGMALASEVAERVLAGLNGSTIGGATHYHANYVSPYWAPSLVRVATIGAHIFYRRPGAPDFAAPPPGTGLGLAEPVIAWAAPSPSSAALVAPHSSSNAPNSVVFAPWGLSTALISASGKIKPLGN